MRRALALAALAILLVAGAVSARLSLERSRTDDPPASLLYLPKGPYLRAMALGHEETLADLLYIWSIQYYSNYDNDARFDYLREIYLGAITELDPLFTEAYLVGAMIMSWEARDPDLALELYDKALIEMPQNWEVAYWAGWECYNAQRYEEARAYWARASRAPDAPPQLIRLAARMLEHVGSLEDAIAEYRRILADPPDERTAEVVRRWLRHTETRLTLSSIADAIDAFERRTGRCPSDLAELVRSGDLAQIPVDLAGQPYRYDAISCAIETPEGDALEGAR